MRAGQLRHRITIQSRSTAQDAMGAATESWDDIASLWASVEQAETQATEKFAGSQFSPESIWHITTRFFSGVTPLDRILILSDGQDDERVMDIINVSDKDRRHREILFTCKERVLSTVTAQ